MWCDGQPEHEGWYLCAWKIGERSVYAVGKWTGGEWLTSMSADPHLYQEIDSPAAQDKMLDELYERNERLH